VAIPAELPFKVRSEAKSKRRQFKPVKKIIEGEGYDKMPLDVPTSASHPPSSTHPLSEPRCCTFEAGGWHVQIFEWCGACGGGAVAFRVGRAALRLKLTLHDSACRYTGIEAPPSLLPAKKYCDLTGLEAKYTDPKSKLRYFSATEYAQVCLAGCVFGFAV